MIKKLVNSSNKLADSLKLNSTALLLGFLVLACHHFWTPGFFLDGAIYAAIGKGMAESTNWLIPSYNQFELNPFFEHPPFYFMFEALIFKLLGASWASARLVSLAFALGVIAVLRNILKRFSDTETTFWSCFILLLTPLFLKLARYPNLDMAMTFFGLLSLRYFLCWEETPRLKIALISGLFLGLAFLMKGHAALMFPCSMVLYLVLQKKFIKFTDYKLYSIFMLALAVFCLWPLLLMTQGRLDVFYSWFQKQFVTTVVHARGLQENNYFLYVSVLLKSAASWFILALAYTFYFFRKKLVMRSSGQILMLALFWSTLIPFSLVRWKYSHYLAPLLPAMATMAGSWIPLLRQQIRDNMWRILSPILIIAAVILWATPIGGTNRREPILFEILEKTRALQTPPATWIDVDSAYGYWSFSATVQFVSSAVAVRQNAPEFVQYLHSGANANLEMKSPRLYYLNKSVIDSLGSTEQRKLQEKFVTLATFSSGTLAIIERGDQ